MSAIGLFMGLISTDVISSAEEKQSRNNKIFFGALVFDIIYFVTMVTLGSLATQGKVFSAAMKKDATIAFFTLAAANFLINTIILGFGAYIQVEDEEEEDEERYLPPPSTSQQIIKVMEDNIPLQSNN